MKEDEVEEDIVSDGDGGKNNREFIAFLILTRSRIMSSSPLLIHG